MRLRKEEEERVKGWVRGCLVRQTVGSDRQTGDRMNSLEDLVGSKEPHVTS